MPLPVTTPTRTTCTRGAPHCTLSNRCPRKPPPSPRQHRRECTTSHPRPQILPPPATPTHPTRAQGAQPRTLDSRCAHQLISSQPQPAPKAHNIASSATNTRAGRLPHHATPRPGCTALHPQQQMHAPTTLNVTPSHTQGTLRCTLGNKYPTARSLNPSNPRPRRTTPHPRQQMPLLAASLTTLPRAQGAQPRTLNNRCTRQLISSQPQPRRRHTTLHPQPQISLPIATITTPTNAQGALQCTIGDRNPCQSP